MKRGLQLSAAQLAALSGLGGLLAASSFFVLFNPWTVPPHHPPHFTALFFFFLTLLLSSGLLSFRSATGLESGIASERWPEAEIDSLRELARSSTANILTVALLVGFVLAFFVFPRFKAFGWSLYLLLIWLNFLRSQLRRTPAPNEAKWTNLAPIQSNHWGKH
jgi:hypothetical protein